ncbi:MAG TPA: DUF3105 domain-containing protein [Nitrolancea sp.]|nr:DUF3105 domain-containing protein [Nitrolancea sp.]
MSSDHSKQGERPPRRWNRFLYAGLILSALILAMSACGGASGLAPMAQSGSNQNSSRATTGSKSAGDPSPPEGVHTFGTFSRDHTELPVTYPQTPPVGGAHSADWQNCGFYDKPVRNEHGVHSMEHGAVWITYRPDLPSDQVDILKKHAQQSFILVSPYPDLPSPVVASTWSAQLRLDSASDPLLDQFVRYYREGPQTPEPGAPCTGGTSATQ